MRLCGRREGGVKEQVRRHGRGGEAVGIQGEGGWGLGEGITFFPDGLYMIDVRCDREEGERDSEVDG